SCPAVGGVLAASGPDFVAAGGALGAAAAGDVRASTTAPASTRTRANAFQRMKGLLPAVRIASGLSKPRQHTGRAAGPKARPYERPDAGGLSNGLDSLSMVLYSARVPMNEEVGWNREPCCAASTAATSSRRWSRPAS